MRHEALHGDRVVRCFAEEAEIALSNVAERGYEVVISNSRGCGVFSLMNSSVR